MSLKPIGIALVVTIGFAQAPAPSPGELWDWIKSMVTGADGDRYFKLNIEDAVLPPLSRFAGQVVTQVSAHELIVNIHDPAGDASLRFLLALKGAIPAGTSVHFQGVARSYTKNPYRLTMEVEGDGIDGLPPGAIPKPGKSK